ncbi:MAG: hypothetical protein KatS3mg085_198 [Candidatus Dojkabacteria bacterium]|nr:MAG: hypothetical protein KatS3mg085_198 [Candidatus Dojkabacteria bacterium]
MKLNFSLNSLNVLIYINLFVFVLVYLVLITLGPQSIDYDLDSRTLIGVLEINNGSINSLGTLITSIFLHINILHILINMYSLFKVGEIVYNLYDGKKLFLTYVIGGLGGSLMTFVYYSLIIKEDVSTIGASGAIFALVGLLVGGSLKKYRYGYNLPINFQNVLFVALMSLSIGLIPGLNVNNLAHIGGFLTGIIIGLFLKHSLGTYETLFEKKLVNFLYKLSIVMVVLGYTIVFYDVIIS